MTSLDEEIEVLISIYADNIVVKGGSQSKVVSFTDENFDVSFNVPPSYPVSQPIMTLTTKIKFLSKQDLQLVEEEVSNIIRNNEGSVVLFQCIEFIRTKFEEVTRNQQEGKLSIADNVDEEFNQLETNSGINSVCPSPAQNNSTPIEIFHGEIITERRSTFQAHMSYVSSMDDVYRFRQQLLSDKKVLYTNFFKNISMHVNIYVSQITDSKSYS